MFKIWWKLSKLRMGNENSHLSGLQLEEKAVEVTDFWIHHSASVNSGNITNLSVFVGEPLVGGSLWVNQTPLEKASKVRRLIMNKILVLLMLNYLVFETLVGCSDTSDCFILINYSNTTKKLRVYFKEYIRNVIM